MPRPEMHEKFEFAKKAIIKSQLHFMCGSNFYETDVNRYIWPYCVDEFYFEPR